MPEMTWKETIQVADFLQLRIIDLQKCPTKYIEAALVIIRARTNE